MKISELVNGHTESLVLAIKSVSANETNKNKPNAVHKPYLDFVFTDGTDTISAKYWDWKGNAIPTADKAYNITAQVGEWQGVPQLTVKTIAVNNDVSIEEFVPKSGINLDDVFLDALQLASTIEDPMLQQLTRTIYMELKPLWLTVPGANSIHHAFVGGTLVHSLSTAQKAKVMAEVTEGANVDLCTAGALLHDVGKLFGYHFNGSSIEMTDEGKLMEHLFIGTHFVDNTAERLGLAEEDNADKLLLLKHIILSHHAKLEYGAVVTPATIDAVIVSRCDDVDAATEAIREASRKVKDRMWTDKVWSMDNKPTINPAWINAVFNQPVKFPESDNVVS